MPLKSASGFNVTGRWIANVLFTPLFIIALTVCGPTAALAQTKVPANQPLVLSASFTHDGQNTDGYRIKLDGKSILDIPISQLKGGAFSGTQPITLAAGSHSLQACAYNAGGEGCAPAQTVDAALVPPSNPTNFVVTFSVSIAQDGTISIVGVTAARQ